MSTRASGQSFIAMELLAGPEPQGAARGRRRCRSTRSSTSPARWPTRSAAAHEQGIMHRDITPGQHLPDRQRAGEAARLRAGEALPAADERRPADRRPDGHRRRRRDDPLHGARTVLTDEARWTTAATCFRSAPCSIRWPPARGRSTATSKSDARSRASRTQPHVPMRQLAPQHPVAARADHRHAAGQAARRPLPDGVGARAPSSMRCAHRGRWRPARRAVDARRPARRWPCCRSRSSASGDRAARAFPRRPRRRHRQPLERHAGSPGGAADVDPARWPASRFERSASGSASTWCSKAASSGPTAASASSPTWSSAARRAVGASRAQGRAPVRRHPGGAGRDRRRHRATASPRRSSQRAAAARHQDPEAYHAFKRGQHHWKRASPAAGGRRSSISSTRSSATRSSRSRTWRWPTPTTSSGFYCLMKPAWRLPSPRGRPSARWRSKTRWPRRTRSWRWRSSAATGTGTASEQRVPARADARPRQPAHPRLLLVAADAARPRGRRVRRGETGHALAPSSRLVAAARAQTLYLARRYDEAIELCNECLAVDPDYVFALHLRGLCYLAKSQHARRDRRPRAGGDAEPTARRSISAARALLRRVRHARRGARR